jgi:hypothetical protein
MVLGAGGGEGTRHCKQHHLQGHVCTQQYSTVVHTSGLALLLCVCFSRWVHHVLRCNVRCLIATPVCVNTLWQEAQEAYAYAATHLACILTVQSAGLRSVA